MGVGYMLAKDAATVRVMGAPSPTCPICRREIGPLSTNPAFPFCSPQCKLLDLGRWLDGGYRVAGPPLESESHAPAPLDEEDE